ncbi:flavin oxidoreductase [Karstenula rhodostoma CBS 690.94]|uniref:Flavin oxidoreductase n=1 Tax=Karstenula rhodostoma CBS 690.94 TaxID=1392251 RepID=A0A9P4PGK0_9PLEO|nr:flavin oxidoreductase [Karstenula rhodostoma CBS 690.94]
MSIQLSSPLKTPSGVVFQNRLVKAAMAESLAATDNDPSNKYITLYDTWSQGGWGAVITGKALANPPFPDSNTSPRRNGSLNSSHGSPPSPSQTVKDKWTRWALAAQQHDTPAIVQLVHPGRQSPVGCGEKSFFTKALAPSAVPVVLGTGVTDWLTGKLLFGTPRAMSIDEIHEAVAQFAAAAKLCHESGFAGVQIHAAHGFLLTQFLSPKSNTRTDAYGGTPANRTRIVLDVLRAVRAVVPPTFCIGVKLNSADVGGRESLDESLAQVGLIVNEGIDFLEVSGGTVENLRMAAGDAPAPPEPEKSARTMHREAFFLDYARAVRARYPDVLLMVTGGFRSRAGMREALDSGACDLIGLARPSAVWPRLPKEVLLNEQVEDEYARCDLRLVRGNWFVRSLAPKIVGVGVDTLYYAGQIERLAEGKETSAPPVGA